ncbi:MAG: phage antirepressor KilAC domain-containing protein, partial [Bacteroidota bacterium]
RNILRSGTTLTVSQIASEFGMTAHALNSFLEKHEVQYKIRRQWILRSKYKDKGYTKTETVEYTRTNGEIETNHYTVWTEKGRKFIHKLVAKVAAKAS